MAENPKDVLLSYQLKILHTTSCFLVINLTYYLISYPPGLVHWMQLEPRNEQQTRTSKATWQNGERIVRQTISKCGMESRNEREITFTKNKMHRDRDQKLCVEQNCRTNTGSNPSYIILRRKNQGEIGWRLVGSYQFLLCSTSTIFSEHAQFLVGHTPNENRSNGHLASLVMWIIKKKKNHIVETSHLQCRIEISNFVIWPKIV